MKIIGTMYNYHNTALLTLIMIYNVAKTFTLLEEFIIL